MAAVLTQRMLMAVKNSLRCKSDVCAAVFLATMTGTVGAATGDDVMQAQSGYSQEPPFKTSIPDITVDRLVSRPMTPVEFLKNIKYVLDHDLLTKDKFFKKNNIKNIFNLTDVTVLDEKNRIMISSNRFAAAFPPIKTTSTFFGAFIPGASFIGEKSKNLHGDINCGLNFNITTGGPKFEATFSIFGNSFSRLPRRTPFFEEKIIETSDPHGSETWQRQYSEHGYSKSVTLGFDPAGGLSSILIEIETVKQDK